MYGVIMLPTIPIVVGMQPMQLKSTQCKDQTSWELCRIQRITSSIKIAHSDTQSDTDSIHYAVVRKMIQTIPRWNGYIYWIRTSIISHYCLIFL